MASQIEVPVTIIAGLHDSPVFLKMARDIFASLSGPRHLAILAAGHSGFHSSDEKDFIAAVDQFFDDLLEVHAR